MMVSGRNWVGKRVYPELLKVVEQQTHAEVDRAYPDTVFTHRGQSWHEDGNILTLEVWAFAESDSELLHDLGRF